MKVKEILKLQENKNGSEEFEKMMTEEEFKRMNGLGIQYAWELLDMMSDGAKSSGLGNDDEYITISQYLDYLENTKNQ